MVLHNNKWDKRAKAKYLKKHGIVQETQKEELPPTVESFNPAEVADAITQITLPDQEVDSEEEQLINAHNIKQALQYEDKRAFESSDSSIFQKAAEGYERSKLNERVRKHISRQAKEIELDSDSDFDNFMDNLTDPIDYKQGTPSNNYKIEINENQKELLDKLLNT